VERLHPRNARRCEFVVFREYRNTIADLNERILSNLLYFQCDRSVESEYFTALSMRLINTCFRQLRSALTFMKMFTSIAIALSLSAPPFLPPLQPSLSTKKVQNGNTDNHYSTCQISKSCNRRMVRFVSEATTRASLWFSQIDTSSQHTLQVTVEQRWGVRNS